MSNWDEFLKIVNPGQQQANTPPAAPSATQPATQSGGDNWNQFLKIVGTDTQSSAEPPTMVPQQPNTQPQTAEPAQQAAAQDESFQLRMAKQKATENADKKLSAVDLLQMASGKSPLNEIDQRTHAKAEERRAEKTGANEPFQLRMAKMDAAGELPKQQMRPLTPAEQMEANRQRLRADNLAQMTQGEKGENTTRNGEWVRDDAEAARAIDRIFGVDRTQVTGGKTNWGKLVLGNYVKGMYQWANNFWKTANMVLDEPAQGIHDFGTTAINSVIETLNAIPGVNIKELEYGDNFVRQLYNISNAEVAAQRDYFAANANTSRAAQLVDRFGTETVAAVPFALEALFVAGAKAPQLIGNTTKDLRYLSSINGGKGIEVVGSELREGIEGLARNPQFWSSYLQTAGGSYEEALQDGMDEGQAAIYALTNGAMNAAIEVGGIDEALGGIQNMTNRKNGGNILREALLAGGQELGEEIEQGITGRGLKAMSGQDVPLVSFDKNDTRAIINPWTAAEEGIGGFVVGSLLGGGQTAISNIGTRAASTATQAAVSPTAQEAAQQAAPAAAETPAQSAEIEREASGDTPAPPATENAATGESGRLNRGAAASEPTTAEARTPAGDFTPKKATKWNPNSQRGKAEIKAARQLRKDTGLWGDSKAAAEAVHRVAESMRDRGRGTDVMDVARQAVDEMMQTQKSGLESGDRDLYNRVREYLRGTDIQVSDELRGDIADFTAWKREAMKKIRLRQNGRPIDSVYAELSNIAGEGVLPPDVTAHSDQIANILHLLDTMRPQAIMMSDAFSGADYEAIRDGIAEELARAAAATVGGKWKGYTPGESMGGKSEAAIRHEAIELEMDVAAMDGNDLSREEAARIVDERYIKYGVYNEAEVMAMEETEGTENGTDETGEETETAPGDAAAETERTADTGAAEDGGTGVYGVVGRDVPAQQQTGDVTEQNRQRERLPREVERGFSENVRTDANMEQEIRDDFTADPEYYTQLANKDTLGKAQAIYDRGIDEARATVDRAIEAAKAGRKLAPEMVPLARMVANELTRNGDVESARRILSDLAVELTQAGQLGQAAKILRGVDPQTAVKAVQKALDKINKQVKDRWGERSNWKAELTKSERAMLESLDMTDEQAFEDAYRQIAKRVGAEMPATLWEKLTELRRVWMLLKPRTQGRNVSANVPMIALRKGAETMSGAIQDALVKSGALKKAEQTRSVKGMTKEIRQMAKDYVKANKDTILKAGDKWDMNSVFREYRTYFKNGALTKAMSKLTGKEQQNVLESARRLTYKLLELGDAPFVMSAYQDSLAQYCAAQGISSAENITPEAMQFALANAMEATFKNANVIADFINQIKRQGGAAGAAVDILFPFTTTPLNITSLMMKYSPAGFASTLMNRSKMSKAERIDAYSKATVGSLLFGMGILLRGLGGITGAADDDKDKAAYDKAKGISPYSIGGKWSYDWAQPAGSLLALGAEVYDSVSGQESALDALFNAMYTAGDSVLNMSLFQNVTKLMRGYGSNTEAIVNAIMEGGASQLVPGLAGDLAKILDGTVRTSYTGGNALETALAKAGVNLPGLSKRFAASVNVRGEEQTRGPLGVRVLETLLDPGSYNVNKAHKMDEYIDELYDDTHDKTIFPSVSPYKFDYGGESYQMTGEEREQFQKTQGQTYYELLEDLVDDGVWGSLSDKEKIRVLEDVRAFALDEAKRELVEGRGEEYESSNWEKVSALANEKPDVLGMYLGVKTAINSGIKNKNYDELDDVLGESGAYSKLPEEAQDMLSSIDGLSKLVKIRENGASAEAAMKAYDAVHAVKPADGKKSRTQQQEVDAIIGADLSDKEKLAAIKAYTSDSYAEKVQTAYDSGVSLEEWSCVYAARQRINNGEGSAQNKATDFAAWLDKNTNLTAAQKDVVQEQLSFYSMNKAEPTHYDGLRESKVDEDTARRIANTMTQIPPLEGKTQATQEQKVDTILGMGLSDGDTWAALKEYTSPSYYKKAAEAYRKGIDLDDYVRQFREADLPNDKGETNGQLSQDELWKYYKANPNNETFVKVMWLIAGFKTDWATYKRKHR